MKHLKLLGTIILCFLLLVTVVVFFQMLDRIFMEYNEMGNALVGTGDDIIIVDTDSRDVLIVGCILLITIDGVLAAFLFGKRGKRKP